VAKTLLLESVVKAKNRAISQEVSNPTYQPTPSLIDQLSKPKLIAPSIDLLPKNIIKPGAGKM
jgi:hypothetical protein